MQAASQCDGITASEGLPVKAINQPRCIMPHAFQNKAPLSSASSDKGMLGITLRYPYEVRKQDEYFADIKDEKVPKDMLDLALHIVNTKRADFDPEAFEDQYEDALKQLIEKKAKGEKIEPAKAGPAPRVVNLMDALRASVDAEKKKGPAPSIQARRPAKKFFTGVPRPAAHET
jgi:DNA end-binding protein Ku